MGIVPITVARLAQEGNIVGHKVTVMVAVDGSIGGYHSARLAATGVLNDTSKDKSPGILAKLVLPGYHRLLPVHLHVPGMALPLGLSIFVVPLAPSLALAVLAILPVLQSPLVKPEVTDRFQNFTFATVLKASKFSH